MSNIETPLVDRAAAAEPPSEEEVRSWVATERVFISSVMEELRDEREAAARAVEEIGATPVLFERFGGRDDDAQAAYTSELDTCGIYVGIIGRRYGKPLPTRYSATHTEYLEAEQRGLRISVWVKDTDDREGHAQSFLEEVRTFHTTSSFSMPEELAAGVRERLRRIAAEALSPWCKLGDVIVRASKVTVRTDSIEVHARVRDDGVAAALERAGPNGHLGGLEGLFSYSGRCSKVRVREVETTTTAATSREFHLTLERRGLPGDERAGLQSSTGNYSPEDLTEIGVREALFGEPNPVGAMRFMTEIPNPIPTLRELGLSDEIVRPLFRLLLTESLVGSGRASRISRFILGPAVNARRRLSLAWVPPRRYTNVEPVERQVEGEVDLP